MNNVHDGIAYQRYMERLLHPLRTLSCSSLCIVCSGVSEALTFALCNLSTRLCFILPECALRFDGTHPQTARLT